VPEAAKAGKHLFVEKPMAATAHGCRAPGRTEIGSARRSNGRVPRNAPTYSCIGGVNHADTRRREASDRRDGAPPLGRAGCRRADPHPADRPPGLGAGGGRLLLERRPLRARSGAGGRRGLRGRDHGPGRVDDPESLPLADRRGSAPRLVRRNARRGVRDETVEGEYRVRNRQPPAILRCRRRRSASRFQSPATS
jgi:hypothetical protein